jgi:hypothetical protein
LIRDEFTKLYPAGTKVKYPEFVKHMKSLDIDIPPKPCSINKFFGKTPYIQTMEYAYAIIRGDNAEIWNIEEQHRNKWYEDSKLPKNQELKKTFEGYFNLATPEEKQAFEDDNLDLFKNLQHKAMSL